MSIDYVKCPVCGNTFNKRGIKVHLKNYHGWRYTEESPEYPQPVEDRNET